MYGHMSMTNGATNGTKGFMHIIQNTDKYV